MQSHAPRRFLRSLPQFGCAIVMAFVSAVGLLVAYAFFPIFGMPLSMAVPGLTFSIGIIAPAVLMARPELLQQQSPEHKAIYRWGFIFTGIAYAIIASWGFLLVMVVAAQCGGEHGCDMGGGIFGYFGFAFGLVASITAVYYWMLAGRAGRRIPDGEQSEPRLNRGEQYAFSLAYIVVLQACTGSALGVSVLALAELAIPLRLLDALGLVGSMVYWVSAVLVFLFRRKVPVQIASVTLLAVTAAVLLATGVLAGSPWIILVLPAVGIYALPLYLLLSGRLAGTARP